MTTSTWTMPPVTMTEEATKLLRKKFPRSVIRQRAEVTCRRCRVAENGHCEAHGYQANCDVCGVGHTLAMVHVDYVGHAHVTERLNQVDPTWLLEPLSRDQFGRPVVDDDGNLWVRLTVCGVSKIDVGSGDSMKDRLANGLRRAAMRFGVGLEQWKAARTVDDATPRPDAPPAERPRASAVLAAGSADEAGDGA